MAAVSVYGVTGVAVARVTVRRLVVFGDEHRRQILQAVFGFDAREMPAMADQFIRHLIDDESGVILRGKGIEGVLEEFALFVGLENAEGDAGDDTVAMAVTAFGQFLAKEGGVAIQDDDARIVAKLVFEVIGENRVELEEDQGRIAVHAPGNLAGVAAFTGSIFGDDARLAQVHFAGDPPDEGAGTWDD